jgi:hypothetical protein
MALKGFPVVDTKKRRRKFATDESLKLKLTECMGYFNWEKKELHEKCKEMGIPVKPIFSKGQFLEYIFKEIFKDIIKS